VIPYKDALRNERWHALEVFLATPALVVIQQYVPVLVTRLGASPLLLGILTSGGAVMLVLASSLGPLWLQRMPRWRPAMLIPLMLWRSVLLAIPLLLLLPAGQAEAIVLLVVLLNFAAGFSNYTFTSYLPRMTLPDRLARLVSTRWTMLGLGMALFTVVLAAMLDYFAIPLNYAIVCVLAFVIGLAGAWCLMQTKPEPINKTGKIRPRARVRDILAYGPARNFLLVTLLAQIALNAPGPLVTLQMVRVLGATNVEFGWYLGIFWVSVAAFGLVMPALVERFGNTKIFAAGCIGLGLQMVILALATSLPVTWIAGFVGGVTSVMFQVTGFGLVVQSAPPEKYEGFVGIHQIVVNSSIFIGPLLMTALIDIGLSITVGLLIAAAARAVAGVLALRIAK
jgi:MFS family permease